MKQKETAILIFANSAEKEAVSKPFQYSKDVFNLLNKQTLNIAKKSGLDYFIFSEKQQIGNSFNERFINAIQNVYNKGFKSVITIGNDTPHLTVKHILKTEKQLQNNNIVIGPSTDGGFYLMGLKKVVFNTNTFLRLPWQTSRLNQSISKLAASKEICISYLETLSDIDSVTDIKSIINSFRHIPKSIKKICLRYILIEKEIITYLYSFFRIVTLNQQFNKGSPYTSYS